MHGADNDLNVLLDKRSGNLLVLFVLSAEPAVTDFLPRIPASNLESHDATDARIAICFDDHTGSSLTTSLCASSLQNLMFPMQIVGSFLE
jgi:hypothetical protein